MTSEKEAAFTRGKERGKLEKARRSVEVQGSRKAMENRLEAVAEHRLIKKRRDWMRMCASKTGETISLEGGREKRTRRRPCPRQTCAMTKMSSDEMVEFYRFYVCDGGCVIDGVGKKGGDVSLAKRLQ